MPPKVDPPERTRRGNEAAKPLRKKHYKKRASKTQRERQACHRLATAFHAKLPRELREYVYKHIIEEPILFHVDNLQHRKNAYVDHIERIYSPSYVGHKVACEAAEYYYSKVHFATNFKKLRKTLTKDIFNLGVKPYMYIRTLHVRIRIDKMIDMLVRRGGTDHNGRLIENEAVKESIVKEKRNLNDLYQKLEAGFSLLRGERESSVLKLYVDLTLGEYPDNECTIVYRSQADVTTQRDYERGFLNVLETIRKSVYDMIHSECKVEVTWQMEDSDYPGHSDCDDDSDSSSDRDCGCYDDVYDNVWSIYNIRTLDFFHLSKEEWEKEKATHTYLYGRYNPKAHYKSKDLLRYIRVEKHYNMGFAKNLPEYRARWGYTSFEKLMQVGNWRDDGSVDSGGYSMSLYTNSSAYSDSERPDG